MDINQCLVHFIGNVNRGYERAVADLNDEQLHFLPDGLCCHIAFHAWHLIRTEDNIINFVCQNRKLPVWLREGLDQKWGLPRVAQGTGMTPDEARAVRLPGTGPFIQYIHDVWADVEPYLSSASMEELQSIARVADAGEKTKLQHIVQTVIAHGNNHLGQIMVLRSLQGLPGES